MKFLTLFGGRKIPRCHLMVPLVVLALLLPFTLLMYIERSYLPHYRYHLPTRKHRTSGNKHKAERESWRGTYGTKILAIRKKDASSLASQRHVLPSEDFVRSPDTELQNLYLQHLNSLQYMPNKLFRMDCGREKSPPCFRPPCNVTFLLPGKRLHHMLGTQYPIEKRHRKVLDKLTDQSEPTDLVFMTAASDNHYEEMLGVLKGLSDLIFPRLRNDSVYTFKLLCYDLGLKQTQIKMLQKYGGCTSVIRVPFEDLPPSFGDRRTCAWKPLLIKANVHNSKVTIWMDASVRFTGDDINHVLRHTLHRGIFVTSSGWLMPSHLAVPTLRYFRVQPCLMSRFKEMAGGFIAVRNDRVIRQAVLGPWVSCAFSPDCLCPGKNCYARLKPCTGKIRYSRCHRFDQAVLGLILVNLFDWKASSLYNYGVFKFSRRKFKDFPEMRLEQR